MNTDISIIIIMALVSVERMWQVASAWGGHSWFTIVTRSKSQDHYTNLISTLKTQYNAITIFSIQQQNEGKKFF